MDMQDDTIVYGIDAPARNIPELSLASRALLSQINLMSNNDKKKFMIKHIEEYFKIHPISSVNFSGLNLDWFNVTKSLDFNAELSEYIVVLDFFTYCCINCLHILPDLKALEEKYSPNESPVVVIGIHSPKFDNERHSENVKDALKKYDITHPVANDTSHTVWRTLGISCWPTLVVTGPKGIPLLVLMGEGHREVLINFIDTCVSYFENMRPVRVNPLPLSPYVHVPSNESCLYYPGKVDSFDKTLVISDSGNNRIILSDFNGKVENVIGCGKKGFLDGTFSSCSFNNPQGVTYHCSGVLFVADTDNHAIRKIDLTSQRVETLCGTGKQGLDEEGGKCGTDQEISSPWDVALGHSLDIDLDSAPNILFIAMAGTHQIWGMFLTDGTWIHKSFHPKGTVIRLAGSGLEENRNTSYPLKAGFAQPSGISLLRTSEGESAFVADSESSSIRQFICATGAVKKVLGGALNPKDLFAFGDVDGGADVAKFQHPLGLVTSKDKIYVADTYNNKVKVIEMNEGIYTSKTLFGGDDASDLSKLNEPGGLCLSDDEKLLFIADTNNFSVKIYHIEDKSITKLSLTFPEDVGSKNLSTDITDSSDCFAFYLTQTKTEVDLHLQVELPNSVHFTPGTEQTYSLTSSANVSTEKTSGIINSSTVIPITVDLMEKENATLSLAARLNLCHDQGLCAMKNCSVKVQFLVDQNESQKPFIIKMRPNF